MSAENKSQILRDSFCIGRRICEFPPVNKTNTNNDAARDAGQKEDTGIIYVRVPHQTPPAAFAFETPEELTKWLENQVIGLRFDTYNREQWDERAADYADDEEWMAKWHQPGVDLFNAGAERIVQVSTESETEIYAEKDAPDYFATLMGIVDDYNAQFTLDREASLAVIAGSRKLPSHQQAKTYGVVLDAARELGWEAV